jgi:hypothetical protein
MFEIAKNYRQSGNRTLEPQFQIMEKIMMSDDPSEKVNRLGIMGGPLFSKTFTPKKAYFKAIFTLEYSN